MMSEVFQGKRIFKQQIKKLIQTTCGELGPPSSALLDLGLIVCAIPVPILNSNISEQFTYFDRVMLRNWSNSIFRAWK